MIVEAKKKTNYENFLGRSTLKTLSGFIKNEKNHFSIKHKMIAREI